MAQPAITGSAVPMASTAAPAQELTAAVDFLVSHLSSVLPSPELRTSLSKSLVATLESKYASHWHTEDPERGSAYRAITRSGNSLDDILVQAVKNAVPRLSVLSAASASEALRASMGSDRWTMWIDPGCVSIRIHGGGGGVSFNTTTQPSPQDASSNSICPSSSSSSSTKSAMHHSGITEIWGKLPPSIRAITSTSAVMTVRPKTPSKAATRAVTPSASPYTRNGNGLIEKNEASALAAEFEALALNASPVKRNKAIAIVRPDSAAAAASSNALPPLPSAAAAAVFTNKALAAVAAGTVAAPVATPPRPLPPLSFTIQESTSPYVPSFAATTGAVTSDASKVPHSAASTTGSSSTRSATPTPPLALEADVNDNITGLTSPPLYTSESLMSSSSSSSAASSSASSSDPFARPSSRSSTTSVGSNASCSIFSHSSSESRSSSIGSFSTMASSVPSLAETAKPSSGATPKASPGEMDAAMHFTFPNSNSNNTLTVTSLAGLLPGSAPNSPSKSRRASRHNHTMSTSSIVSAASSAGSATSKSTTGHGRSRSSRSEVRVSAHAGQVQDYSNGKVGVLGGGVLLGLGGGSKKNTDNGNAAHKRAHSNASTTSTLNVAGASAATAAQRPRSKSRTPSSGSATSTGSNGEHYYAQQHHQHQHQHAHAHNMYHHQAGANQYWQAAQAYRYGAPPVPMVPPQYASQGY